jgi:hypothetical protein
MLFNVGVHEAMKVGFFDCFIFHDVDLLPESGRISYNCHSWPVHMAAAISKFNYE